MKDYHINIFYSEDKQGYIADIPDLETCSGFGRSPAEALAEVEKTKQRWFEAACAAEKPIPEPHYRMEINSGVKAVATNAVVAESEVTDGQPSDEETLNYIAERVSQHQCILFLGSAIHVPPPPDLTQYDYPKEKAPPIGSQLSKYLAEKGDYQGQDWWNLQRVAQHFESKKTRFRLVDEIKKAVHAGREPSPILGMLADLEFPIVITTNYDHLYEQALVQKAKNEKAAGQVETKHLSSVYSPNTTTRCKTLDCASNPDPRLPYILKIHGDVDKPESIVLTDEDYIQFVLRMSDKQPFHPFGNNVLAHLMKWPTLFIGYSLMDYNLRLLFKTLRWKLDAAQIPPIYSVDKRPDVLIRDVWENQRRYVSFIPQNLWDFVPRLHAAVGKGRT